MAGTTQLQQRNTITRDMTSSIEATRNGFRAEATRHAPVTTLGVTEPEDCSPAARTDVADSAGAPSAANTGQNTGESATTGISPHDPLREYHHRGDEVMPTLTARKLKDVAAV